MQYTCLAVFMKVRLLTGQNDLCTEALVKVSENGSLTPLTVMKIYSRDK